MDHDAFVSVVRRMRAAQKRYFKTRLREAMDDALRLEHEVDQALEDEKQPGLFPRQTEER